MINSFTQFLVLEDGAITVDWVVLTAALVGLAMVVLTPVAYSTDSSAQDLADFIVDVPVGYTD